MRDNLTHIMTSGGIKIMELSKKQIQTLKGLAHKLEPVVSIGKNGITESLLQQVEDNLKASELIKVKVHTDSREDLFDYSESVASKSKAFLVQVIGKMIVLYRESEKKKISL